VILPKENEKDLEDLPKYLRKDMHFIFATTVDDVLAAALRKTLPRKIAGKKRRETTDEGRRAKDEGRGTKKRPSS